MVPDFTGFISDILSIFYSPLMFFGHHFGGYNSDKNHPQMHYHNYYPPSPSYQTVPYSGHQHMMMPHYVLQVVLLGAAVIFALLVVGFLVILDRARLTPVVRARQREKWLGSLSLDRIEEMLNRAHLEYGNNGGVF